MYHICLWSLWITNSNSNKGSFKWPFHKYDWFHHHLRYSNLLSWIWLKSPILTTHIIFYAFPACLWHWQDMYKVNGSTTSSPCTQSKAPISLSVFLYFIPTLFSSLRIWTKPCMAVYGDIHHKPYAHQGVWVCLCVVPASKTLKQLPLPLPPQL